MNRVGLAIAAIGLVSFAGSALAHKDIYCSDMQCSGQHKLSQSSTTEFRGRCGVDRYLAAMHCKPGNSSVSCTVTYKGENTLGYDSCSCTNWDPTKGHDATVTVGCTARPSP